MGLGFSAMLDKAYVASDRQRIELYRRVVGCQSLEDLEQLAQDIKDMFGPLSSGTQTVLDLAEIQILAGGWTVVPLEVLDFLEASVIMDWDRSHPIFPKAPGTVR